MNLVTPDNDLITGKKELRDAYLNNKGNDRDRWQWLLLEIYLNGK